MIALLSVIDLINELKMLLYNSLHSLFLYIPLILSRLLVLKRLAVAALKRELTQLIFSSIVIALPLLSFLDSYLCFLYPHNV